MSDGAAVRPRLEGRSLWVRDLVELAVAVGLVLAVAHGMPRPGDLLFEKVVLVAPLWVAALRAIARRGRRLVGRGADIWAGLAVGLALLTLGRQRLGLVNVDTVLASAWVVVAAGHLKLVVLSLRPLLGLRLPRRPSWVFFVLPLVVYGALVPWLVSHRAPDGDEPYYLLLTHSLAYDFDTDLANNYGDDMERLAGRALEPQPGDPRGEKGEIFSRHNPLLSAVLVPAYWLAGRWGAIFLLACGAAGVAWMVLRLAYHYAPRRPSAALLAWAITAFASPLLIFSYQVWVEVPAALLFTLALDRLLLLRRRPWTAGQALLFLLPVVLLPLLKLRFFLVSVPLLILAVLRTRPGRRMVWGLAAGLAAGVVLIAMYNTLRFGHPLKMHRLSDFLHLVGSPTAFVRGGLGLFFDPAFGLFGCSPLWMVVLPSLVVAARRRWSLLGDAALLMGPYLLALAPRVEWYGGWSPAFRYPLVFLPLIALLLMPALVERHRRGFALVFGVLGFATLALVVLWVVHPGWTTNFANGRTLWVDHLSRHLGADVARLLPSYVRPRTASWVWPLVAGLMVPLVAWGTRLRRRATLAGAAGVALVLVMGAALYASRSPTRVVELEDVWVEHHGGGVFPTTWTVQRVSYRGAWRISEGSWVRVPVVAGGRWVSLRLELRLAYAETTHPLRILAGDKVVAQHTIEQQDWTTLEIGPLEWPEDEPLVLAGRDANRPGRGGVVVDRVELEWMDSAPVGGSAAFGAPP